MNTEERQVLERFLSRLTDIKGIDKNPEADRLIQGAVARQPDAAYLLIQRNLLLEKALENAKARIEELQRQPAPVNRGGGSFLGGDPWARPAAPTGRTWDATPPGYRQPAAPPQSGAPSFLGNMASTAAGVVAGSFLFQGIESLMHGGQHAPWGASAGERVTENTTINNYYGSDQAPASDEQTGWSGQDDSFLDTGYDFSDDDSSSDDNWI
ncbi:DUF2076 domain-containing protein [Methylococcus sp. ANG]|uniref:DUF2076 domain-containing protein n=1 Tax=Methylococcus sp. ANG TaxID=3231903 RepID=UPI00345B1AFF